MTLEPTGQKKRSNLKRDLRKVGYIYANQSGIEVAYCKVKGQGHHIRRDLRDIADSVALNFLLRHKRR